jgi:hypothetical protein
VSLDKLLNAHPVPLILEEQSYDTEPIAYQVFATAFDSQITALGAASESTSKGAVRQQEYGHTLIMQAELYWQTAQPILDKRMIEATAMLTAIRSAILGVSLAQIACRARSLFNEGLQ